MRVLEVMNKAELDAISYNTKVMMFVETKLEAKLNVLSYNACEERTGEVCKQLDETELDAIGYNAKDEKLLLDKSPNEPAEVTKLIKPQEVPKQVKKAELNATGFNACEERARGSS